MKKLLGVAIAGAFALSACSGTGNTNTFAPTSSNAIGNVSSSQGSVDAASKSRHRHLVRLLIHIKVPKVRHGKKTHRLHPDYISPYSQSITVTLNTVNGSAPPSGLLTSTTTNITNCTNGCTVLGPSVPPGSDNLSFTVYDAQNGSGNPLSSLTQDFTVTPGQANALSATLEGVPASISFTLPSGTAGTVINSTTVAFSVLDADGNQITGSTALANGVTLTDGESDGLNATSLAVNGGTPSSTVTIDKPTDTLKFKYSGLAIASTSVNASGTGLTPSSSPFTVTSTNPSSACSDGGAGVCATTPTNPTINLYTNSGTGSTATLTTTQTGWTNSGYLQDVTESDNCSSYATVAKSTSTNPGGAGTVFTVATSGTPSSAGSCTITLTGGGNSSQNSESVTLTYTTSSIGVNARHRRPN
jgi:hypothetical protein